MNAPEPHTLQSSLRKLPSVDELLREPCIQQLLSHLPRWAVLEAAREALEERRRLIFAGRLAKETPELSSLVQEVQVLATRKDQPNLRKVINATGIVLHTNLGRALLAEEAAHHLLEVALSYSNLEYDLERGDRGSRQAHLERLLTRLTGAEASLVVNNNAAAVLLALNTLADGREVIISRGELIEIGDSFRIPDIMRKAGAILKEVGTTNRTHLKDYESALTEKTALLLKVHTSNFRIMGFTADVPLNDLALLGRRHQLPVMEDLGSGALLDLSAVGLRKEPVVSESVRAGADLVTFSGDKLLGGPQAGVIVGRKTLIESLRRNPLARAIRVDKFTVAALEVTLRLYLDEGQVWQRLPTLQVLALPKTRIEARANRLLEQVQDHVEGKLFLSVEDGFSEVGGGALPLEELPTKLLALRSPLFPPEEIEARLRRHDPPIMARIKDDQVLLDLRTVQEQELAEVAKALIQLAGGS